MASNGNWNGGPSEADSLSSRVYRVEERQDRFDERLSEQGTQLLKEVSYIRSLCEGMALSVGMSIEANASEVLKLRQRVKEFDRKLALALEEDDASEITGRQAKLDSEQADRLLKEEILRKIAEQESTRLEKQAQQYEARLSKSEERDHNRGAYWTRYAVGVAVIVSLSVTGTLLVQLLFKGH